MELDFEKSLVEIEEQIQSLTEGDEAKAGAMGNELSQLKRRMTALRKEIYSKLTPWQTVQVARHSNRPTIRDYTHGMCSEFIELHGDRLFGDDQGILGGFATIAEQRVMLIGHQKGKTVEENVAANFGMANPEGYRKALRLMKLAEKYQLPVISLIDTPGAYPGLEAEARGQAEAIARNLAEISRIETPIIVIVTGEGGSGGALGIGVGDVVLMLAHAVYSVISPEGCASILWRDGAKAPEAAEALKITANSLLELGVIDGIIPEPLGGAHRDHEQTFKSVREAISGQLAILRKLPARRLLDKRFHKYTNIGKFDKRKYTVH